MKKGFVIFLASVLLVGLCACGGASGTVASGGNTSQEESTSSTSMLPESDSASQAEAPSEPELPAAEVDMSNSLGLVNVENARQVAGLVTSDGRTVSEKLLLRTGRLEDITDNEINILLTQYNLSDVIDLRSQSDVEKNPDRENDGVDNHLIALYPDDFSAQLMERMVVPEDIAAEYGLAVSGESDNPFHQNPDYIGFLLMGGSGEAYDSNFSHAFRIMANDEHSRQAFTEMFNVLMNSEGSTIIHCTSGKDRTGAALALILDLLGCDRDDIMDEYLLTNAYNADMIAEKVKAAKDGGYPEVYLEAIPMIHGVTPYCLETFFEEIDAQYGSVQAYAINALGLSEQQIQSLKDKYTHG